ncbi:membrane protein insertion efficiency factor YidD [Hydrogenophaga sp. PAMC20947]|uniref:membrane protein insertion efficiency factor YidD n=1 Tax=Hydrogenophaga sp. PAMC20947 TaxID=2565558 RepID=UPI00109E211B|nr:membrane protein insertion efficiency factor YidD [Hydrogenophaga sp. PAMC20947]QCB47685.1 membrane protein insertion efficiency factor YidD [Hydrogenophaga sp. PAMC20947]
MWTDWPRQGLVGLVKGYRLLLSPSLGSNCRFEPSCSKYALGVLERHGALAGSYLTLRRLGRCHPWCDGGCDPVPDQPPALFSRLLSPSSEKKNAS